jgi:hypothetical protein
VYFWAELFCSSKIFSTEVAHNTLDPTYRDHTYIDYSAREPLHSRSRPATANTCCGQTHAQQKPSCYRQYPWRPNPCRAEDVLLPPIPVAAKPMQSRRPATANTCGGHAEQTSCYRHYLWRPNTPHKRQMSLAELLWRKTLISTWDFSSGFWPEEMATLAKRHFS